jgi:hypothetical protein
MANSAFAEHPHPSRSRESYLERHPATTVGASITVLVLVGLVVGELVGQLAVLVVKAVLALVGSGS